MNTQGAPISFLAKLEQVAKIISLLVLPVIVAGGGWIINRTLNDQKIGQEYVKIAIEILRDDRDKQAASLRSWAIAILKKQSPVNFTPEEELVLETGIGKLPASTRDLIYDSKGRVAKVIDGKGNAITYTYDDLNRLISASQDGMTKIYEYDSKGRLIRVINPLGISTEYKYSINLNK